MWRARSNKAEDQIRSGKARQIFDIDGDMDEVTTDEIMAVRDGTADDKPPVGPQFIDGWITQQYAAGREPQWYRG